jgi:hypothetical protein
MSVLFIFGVSFFFLTSQQITNVKNMDSRLKARILAESALEKAQYKIQAEFENELLWSDSLDKENPIFEINNRLMELIDISRIEDFVKVLTFDKDELIEGGEASVIVEVVDVKANEFYTYIDYQEKIPESLAMYQKPRNAKSTMDLEPLGGFSARVRFTSVGKFGSSSVKLEMVKEFNVNDITPPAPDHTLFVHSVKKEVLKEGVFHLSNLDLPPIIVKLLQRLSNQIEDNFGFEVSESKEKALHMIDQLNVAFNDSFSHEPLKDTLKTIDEMAQMVTDDDISETVDNIILSLSPRNWGRVRTNGRLDVYMPFFAADDIINYFAETGSWRELPEVGYLFHNNRLHDPYMSVYTHYEGLIYKHYRKIYPSQFGIVEPEEVPPEQYTINTRLEYPRRYKDRYDIENLSRLKDSGMNVAKYVIDNKAVLRGTEDVPIRLEGLWWFRNGLEIGGTYTGRGLIVSEKAIQVTGDLVKKNRNDSLSLVCLWDEIQLEKLFTKIQAALYAHKGLKSQGCQSARVFGNLSVEELNRERMPREFVCRFDYNIKNHMVDNLYGYFTDSYLYYREMNRKDLHVLEEDFSVLPKL